MLQCRGDGKAGVTIFVPGEDYGWSKAWIALTRFGNINGSQLGTLKMKTMTGPDLTTGREFPTAGTILPTKATTPITDQRLLPKKVLIVDDDPVILQTAVVRLKSAGYEVLTALDPSQAITAVGSNKLDVILLDINFPPDVPHGGMPSWDGLHLMCWLRTLENSANACFIIISGESLDIVKRHRLAGPAVAFFQKPIDYKLLLKTIAKHLSSRKDD